MKGWDGVVYPVEDTDQIDDEIGHDNYYQELIEKAARSDHPGVKEKLEELIVITELVHGHENVDDHQLKIIKLKSSWSKMINK